MDLEGACMTKNMVKRKSVAYVKQLAGPCVLENRHYRLLAVASPTDFAPSQN